MSLIITDGLPRGAGYLEVDQRNVDVPDAELRPILPGEEMPPGAKRYFEADTYTCTHCSVVVVMNPVRKRERYKCKGCNHHICDPCAADMAAGAQCVTMEQKFQEHMERVTRQPDQPSNIILP